MASAATAAPPKASTSFQSASNSFNEQAPQFQMSGDARERVSAPRRKSFLDTPLPHQSPFYRKRQRCVIQPCGGCTGLRNTPTPATLTSTVSPATNGPTPAGVPVAITSPGAKVIMREIQRTRNAGG